MKLRTLLLGLSPAFIILVALVPGWLVYEQAAKVRCDFNDYTVQNTPANFFYPAEKLREPSKYASAFDFTPYHIKETVIPVTIASTEGHQLRGWWLPAVTPT